MSARGSASDTVFGARSQATTPALNRTARFAWLALSLGMHLELAEANIALLRRLPGG